VTDERVAAGLREQLASWRAELQGGAERVGWKIAFNLPAVREGIGIDAPTIGYLTSATRLEDGAEFPGAGTSRLVAEPEIAIEAAGGGGIASYAPAIELADFNRPFDQLQAIVAEDIFHRGLILGASVPELPETPSARVVVNGEERASATAPGDYFDGVLDLVSSALEGNGESLHPGDRIICGVITPPVPISSGDEVRIEYGALGELSVRVT